MLVYIYSWENWLLLYNVINFFYTVAIYHNKTGVIHDPLGQTHGHASSEHCFLLFCFSGFKKWGPTYVRTDNMCENNYPLGWPSGSTIAVLRHFSDMNVYCNFVLICISCFNRRSQV